MDKTATDNQSPSPLPAVHKENEKHGKKSPSLKQQFKDQISKIEEKFQNRSHDKHKMNANVDEMSSKDKENDMKKEGSVSPKETSAKKGLKFGIRVFPPTMNEKLFGKSPSKVVAAEKEKEMEEVKPEDVKIDMDMVDNSADAFDRKIDVNSSGIRRDKDGIPQEIPDFMMNAANAARDGRKSNNSSESRKSKGKAPKPPMTQIDLNASVDTMDTELNMTGTDISSTSMMNITANNANNTNMELEDELDRITEKYLNQTKDKLNFSDNFSTASNLLNKTDDSITALDKIDKMDMDDIDDVILRQKEPSNSSTPKSERKMSGKDFISELDTSDADLSTYGKRMELNSSDITVHQANESEDACDENRRAASLGDLSRFEMKKSLSENDHVNTSTLERAQSLDITDNMNQKPCLSLAVTKNIADLSDLTTINGETNNKLSPVIYQMETKTKMEFKANGTDELNKTDQTKIINNYETNIPDDVKVSRYPLGSLERPKSDVLKKLLATKKTEIETKPVKIETEVSSTAPSIVMMTPAIIKRTSSPPTSNSESSTPPMTNGNMTSIVTIENSQEEHHEHPNVESIVSSIVSDILQERMTKILSIDTNHHEMEQPVSLTLINNTIDNEPLGNSQISPIFSSNKNGVNSIKISPTEIHVKAPAPEKLISTTTIVNDMADKNFSGEIEWFFN